MWCAEAWDDPLDDLDRALGSPLGLKVHSGMRGLLLPQGPTLAH